MFRARAARLDAWKRRDDRNAAISIQRVLRGHHGRRRVARERDRCGGAGGGEGLGGHALRHALAGTCSRSRSRRASNSGGRC
jgi:hypothetical protein